MGMEANQIIVAPSLFGITGASHMLSTDSKCILTLDMLQMTPARMIPSTDYFFLLFIINGKCYIVYIL